MAEINLPGLVLPGVVHVEEDEGMVDDGSEDTGVEQRVDMATKLPDTTGLNKRDKVPGTAGLNKSDKQSGTAGLNRRSRAGGRHGYQTVRYRRTKQERQTVR